MSENSPRLVLPHPSETDVPDVPKDMGTLVTALDSKVMGFIEDTFAKRPAPGINNRVFLASDTGVLYLDRIIEWKKIPLYQHQSFPQSFFTGLIVGGGLVGGSERTVDMRAGALVEFKALLYWKGSSDQGVIMNLTRDGVVVDEINVHGLPGGTVQTFLCYVETVGGSHTFAVHIGAYGTTQDFNLENGLITFGI